VKVGIAGAGLVGRLMAWRLSLLGHDVSVHDPAPGPDARVAAGFTAAGMLSPIAELESADHGVAELGWRSLDLWPQWLAQLDTAVHFAQRGSLVVAHPQDTGAAGRWHARMAARSGERRPKFLDPARLGALEPGVLPGLIAWMLEGEGQIHPPQAMLALQLSARRARWQWGRAVKHVEPGRLDEDRYDLAIDARGVGAKEAMPVRGVRGEIVRLHAPGVVLNRPLRLLHPRHRVYVVPRPDNEIVVGASEIESEDRSPVSVRSMVELLAAAHSVLPELAEARIVQAETNLRPALPDNLPRVDSSAGLLRINGLFRHGWLIAPALVDDALKEICA
jgi:glycine oxidase